MSTALAETEKEYRTSADKTREDATKMEEQAKQTKETAQDQKVESTRLTELAKKYLEVAKHIQTEKETAEAKVKTIEEHIAKFNKQGPV